MERMSKLLLLDPGKPGTGFTASESNFVHQGRGIPTSSYTDSIWQNLAGALLLLVFLIGFVTGFCLYREWWIHERAIMAQPVTQGGIDYPDGGFVSGSGVFAMTGDLGELAARLGSVTTHNREGSIVHIESFRHGVQTWHPTLYGTGSEIYVSALRARSGGYSAKLIAGSDGSAAAKIFRSFPLPVLGRYGLEFSWLPEANTDILEWRLTYHDGTNAHHYIARYRTTENDVQIKDENGDWLTVATGLDLTYTYADFHTIKTVGDLENDVWMRLIINDVEHDLSAYPAYVVAEAAGPDVVPAILVWGDAGSNGFSYIDDIILTQNEPEHD